MNNDAGGASASNAGLGACTECRYPKCNCPFDDPGTPGWCARGLRRPFLFTCQDGGAWFVWKQERANETTALCVAGPFAKREQAEELLGPMLAQLEAPNARLTAPDTAQQEQR